MWVIEVSMERRRNERVGETRDPRENPTTKGIVRHDSHMRKLGDTYTPANFRKALKWVSDQYDQIPILITENGWADSGGLNDTMRTRYLMNHFAYLLDAIHLDNVSVIGHTVWSLIDTWEWTDGYTYKFGLHQIDFNDPERKRVPKNSTVAYAKMIKNRKVPEEYLDEDNK
ncbi:hypothetical protein PR048_010025 [Dryococelus australis]|uniref:Uncharacterized protein n=1 Tax=Dryococelus australis TaxID=614101 RepID=A0ABQ9I1K5_9NEOP|nr:hypothetical protein PR048_010025 [Dryococelus australis]